jgi:hypothetical protein
MQIQLLITLCFKFILVQEIKITQYFRHTNLSEFVSDRLYKDNTW